ncbi:hypothetical protein [Kitasatospora griseola]|uniref:hypothetical protein n=1 Tax=Kitasatospora griseola TaxID=2064 RepID=UPI003824868E
MDQQAPVPLPGLSVGSLTELDTRAVLTADPDLSPGERSALNGRCTACEIRPAQYRDLDGDGRPEMLTAVVTDAGRAVLRVYALRGHDVLPALALTVLPGFTAETVGEDLVVHEPTGPSAETSSTYRWNAGRMAFVDRRIKGTGSNPDAAGCLTGDGSAVPTAPSAAASTYRPATPGPAPGLRDTSPFASTRPGTAVQPVPSRN